MLDTYTILKAIHVLAVALWVGAGFGLNIAITLAFATKDRQTFMNSLKFAEFMGPRIFAPLSVIVLGMGIWLTAKFYAWDLLWVQLGLAGFVITFLIGNLFLGPQGSKLAEKLESGASMEEIQAKYTRVATVARIDALVLWSVIVIMVIKPT